MPQPRNLYQIKNNFAAMTLQPVDVCDVHTALKTELNELVDWLERTTQKIAENIDVYKDTTHQHPTTPRPDIITEGQHPKSRGVYGENGTKQRAHTLTLFNERFTTVSAAIRSLEYRFFKQTSCTTGAKWLELKEGVTPLIYLNINNPDDLAKEVLKEEERSTESSRIRVNQIETPANGWGAPTP